MLFLSALFAHSIRHAALGFLLLLHLRRHGEIVATQSVILEKAEMAAIRKMRLWICGLL